MVRVFSKSVPFASANASEMRLGLVDEVPLRYAYE